MSEFAAFGRMSDFLDEVSRSGVIDLVGDMQSQFSALPAVQEQVLEMGMGVSNLLEDFKPQLSELSGIHEQVAAIDIGSRSIIDDMQSQFSALPAIQEQVLEMGMGISNLLEDFKLQLPVLSGVQEQVAAIGIGSRSIIDDMQSQFSALPAIQEQTVEMGMAIGNLFEGAQPQLSGLFAVHEQVMLRLGEQLTGLQSNMQKALAPIFQLYSEQTVFRLSEHIIGLQGLFTPLIDSVRAFDRWFSAFEESEDAVRVFCEIGWPVAPSMPRWLISRVVELYHNSPNETRKRNISNAIRGYYRREDRKHLIEMVNSWQQYTFVGRYRRKNIENALWAHCNERYSLPVGNLIPMIEGVNSQIAVSTLSSASLGSPSRLSKEVIGDPAEYSFSIWATVETLLSWLDDLYGYVPFAQQLTTSVQNRKVNRHTVLHDIMPAYGTETYSLKCFLLLDALFAVLRYREEYLI